MKDCSLSHAGKDMAESTHKARSANCSFLTEACRPVAMSSSRYSLDFSPSGPVSPKKVFYVVGAYGEKRFSTVFSSRSFSLKKERMASLAPIVTCMAVKSASEQSFNRDGFLMPAVRKAGKCSEMPSA